MFVKLFTQILDSSIADDRKLRHFFTDLLLCSDPKGFIMMTESAIARRIGASIEEVEWGIAALMEPDPRSKTTDFEGRRLEAIDDSGYGWRIINFETYKALRSADDMREKTRDRVRRFRDRQKENEECNANVTPRNAGNAMQRKRKRQSAEEEETKNSCHPSDDDWSGVFQKGSLQLSKMDQGATKVLRNNSKMETIGGFYNQRKNTLWKVREAVLLKRLNPSEEEIQEIKEFLESAIESDWPRKTIGTLLGNWDGELAKARAKKRPSTSYQKPQAESAL